MTSFYAASAPSKMPSFTKHDLYSLGMAWDPFGEGFSFGGFMGAGGGRVLIPNFPSLRMPSAVDLTKICLLITFLCFLPTNMNNSERGL